MASSIHARTRDCERPPTFRVNTQAQRRYLRAIREADCLRRLYEAAQLRNDYERAGQLRAGLELHEREIAASLRELKRRAS